MSFTAIRSVTLFDGHRVHQKATVVIDNQAGTIQSVLDSPGDIPADATIVDGEGHTLIPGLIEAHCHVYGLHVPPGTDISETLKTPLKCGVTTVCDMHSDPETVHNFKEQIRSEIEQIRTSQNGTRVTMSDLKSCLYAATIKGGWPSAIVLAGEHSEEIKDFVQHWPALTPETAADYVADQIADGADYIKLMQEDCCSLKLPTGSIPVASAELQQSVVKAAHAKQLLVVAHATSINSTKIALDAGADGATHTILDQPPTEDFVKLFKQTGAFVIPTLVVLSSLTGEEQEFRNRFAELGYRKGFLSDSFRKVKIDVLRVAAETATIQNSYQSVIKLREAGIDIVAGTDSILGLQGTALGPSLWMELLMYVEKCGMSVIDALKSATSVSAKRFGFDDRGSVEVGKRADLVLVKGDVTRDLQQLWEGEGIVGVWKQGLRAI